MTPATPQLVMRVHAPDKLVALPVRKLLDRLEVHLELDDLKILAHRSPRAFQVCLGWATRSSVFIAFAICAFSRVHCERSHMAFANERQSKHGTSSTGNERQCGFMNVDF
jgi:hypothetical protein